ncbi:hypothetical protein GGX14DRAFT_544581 [Mycena pura]|uniref:Zn(2)-C6 fungal-type domain-containing protein n=1 Tax=Mycena pura TaxID=153505 RepID=A0AAD6V6F0_9AGAR|nr:hypothetical protein GGX14DRAFT_544581 [Mycena pura]
MDLFGAADIHQPFGNWPYDPPPLSPPRITLAGSLDPATGIFYRAPEHPRLRTAQACEKCRTRKAKVRRSRTFVVAFADTTVVQCSGDHPSCARCIARGLVCEYAKEGRVRGPNKPKPRTGSLLGSATSPVPPHSPALSSHDGSPAAADKPRRRRNTTMSGMSPLEPLSTHVPLPLALPRHDSAFHPHPHLAAHLVSSGGNKRFSLPAALDGGMRMPFTYTPAYGGDPYATTTEAPDSASGSYSTDSRRGSFDPPFGLGVDHSIKDQFAPLGGYALDAPIAMDSQLQARATDVYIPAHDHAHDPYTFADAQALSPTVGVNLHRNQSHIRSRPGSARSGSGGSSVASASSSSRGSLEFDGGESGPASAVSGSFPLFHGHGQRPTAQLQHSPHGLQGGHSPHTPHLSSAGYSHSPHPRTHSPHVGSTYSPMFSSSANGTFSTPPPSAVTDGGRFSPEYGYGGHRRFSPEYDGHARAHGHCSPDGQDGATQGHSAYVYNAHGQFAAQEQGQGIEMAMDVHGDVDRTPQPMFALGHAHGHGLAIGLGDGGREGDGQRKWAELRARPRPVSVPVPAVVPGRRDPTYGVPGVGRPLEEGGGRARRPFSGHRDAGAGACVRDEEHFGGQHGIGGSGCDSLLMRTGRGRTEEELEKRTSSRWFRAPAHRSVPALPWRRDCWHPYVTSPSSTLFSLRARISSSGGGGGIFACPSFTSFLLLPLDCWPGKVSVYSDSCTIGGRAVPLVGRRRNKMYDTSSRSPQRTGHIKSGGGLENCIDRQSRENIVTVTVLKSTITQGLGLETHKSGLHAVTTGTRGNLTFEVHHSSWERRCPMAPFSQLEPARGSNSLPGYEGPERNPKGSREDSAVGKFNRRNVIHQFKFSLCNRVDSSAEVVASRSPFGQVIRTAQASVRWKRRVEFVF